MRLVWCGCGGGRAGGAADASPGHPGGRQVRPAALRTHRLLPQQPQAAEAGKRLLLTNGRRGRGQGKGGRREERHKAKRGNSVCGDMREGGREPRDSKSERGLELQDGDEEANGSSAAVLGWVGTYCLSCECVRHWEGRCQPGITTISIIITHALTRRRRGPPAATLTAAACCKGPAAVSVVYPLRLLSLQELGGLNLS